MGLALHEVILDSDFPELIQVFRASFTDPGTALWPIFSADYLPSAASRAATLQETAARLLEWHRADPTSHWLKVVDDSTGQIVGGGRWALYESGNPYDEHGDLPAYWWPEGKPQEVASEWLRQFLATSAKLMNRPHAFLNILFTHPEHRRKGVGSLVMKWGLEHADKSGLESFIEATKEGKPCYEKFGFTVIQTNEIHIEKDSADEEWKDFESNILPFTWWSMHKPAKK